MATLSAGVTGIDMAQFPTANPIVSQAYSATQVTANITNGDVEVYTGNFVVSPINGQLTSGTATSYELDLPSSAPGGGTPPPGGGYYGYALPAGVNPSAVYAITGANVSAAQIMQILTSKDLPTLLHDFLPGHDTYVGSSASDVLVGQGGNDTFQGGTGTETFMPAGGNNTIIGGGGFDTDVYAGASTQYTVSINGSTTTVNTPTGVDMLTNVGRIQFSDGVLVINTTDPGAQALRLYQAALDRPPDPVGLQFWTNLITSGTDTLAQAAGGFATSNEFLARYGSLSNDAFITQMYANVLGRAPDPSGFQFWETFLAQNHTQADVLVGFSESTENIALTAPETAHGIFLPGYHSFII
jgi:hypothetical protein